MLPAQIYSPLDVQSRGRAGSTATGPRLRYLTDGQENGHAPPQATPEVAESAALTPTPVLDIVSLSTRKIMVVGRRLSRSDDPPPFSSALALAVATGAGDMSPSRTATASSSLMIDTDSLPTGAVASFDFRQDHPKVYSWR